MKSGDRLGPYEVLGLLGSGGMGEVYRARDPRLDRDVAIKILPAAAAADTERRARFEREAKAIAALNHPNIVTIYAVEEAEGVPFFTMEYVEGQTLARVIPPRGLPLDHLLRIAIPLADAVGAAHQHGILHRDLKPANVMVTDDGRVKVLDFGLAKLKEAVMAADAESRPTAEVTGEGRILGTVAYMSPEQAQGKALDPRSDVFSLGVLLYEMATGQRPFKGDTSVSILSAILKDTPGSVTDLRPDLPRELARILRRALTKDPEHRYQSVKDLRNDLEELKQDLDSGEILRGAGGPAAKRQLWRRPWVMAAVLVAAVGLAVAGTWWASRVLRSPEQVPAARRFFDDSRVTRLTTEQVSDYTVAVSRDGRYVAYAFVEQGRQGLRVRQTETPAAVQVVPPADVRYNGVTFSPDGSRLFYATFAQGSTVATLYEVFVLGGSPRRVIDDVGCRVSFSPDGTRFAFVRYEPNKSGSVVIANADGTGERVLAIREIPNDFWDTDVAWSPDGRMIAAAVAEGWKMALVTVDTTTGAVQAIPGKRWDLIYSIVWPQQGAHLIVAAADFSAADALQLWEVALPDGTIRRITKDTGFYTAVSLNADARTLVAVKHEWHATLWVAPSAQPERLTRIAAVPDTLMFLNNPIRWTADGRILYTAFVGGNYDIWSVRPDGTELRQLTTLSGPDGSPAPTPDGRYIVFRSDRDGRGRLWRMDPDGGRQTPLTNGPYDSGPLVTADSRSVFYVRRDQPGYPLYRTPIEGGEPTLLVGPPSQGLTAQWHSVPAGFQAAELSPDGSLILGSYSDDQHRRRLAVVPADGPGVVQKLDISLQLGWSERSYAWAPNGRAVTLVRTSEGASNLWRQPLDGAPAVRLTNYPPGDEIVLHAWSPDGKLLALVRNATQVQVMMLREAPSDK